MLYGVLTHDFCRLRFKRCTADFEISFFFYCFAQRFPLLPLLLTEGSFLLSSQGGNLLTRMICSLREQWEHKRIVDLMTNESGLKTIYGEDDWGQFKSKIGNPAASQEFWWQNIIKLGHYFTIRVKRNIEKGRTITGNESAKWNESEENVIGET